MLWHLVRHIGHSSLPSPWLCSCIAHLCAGVQCSMPVSTARSKNSERWDHDGHVGVLEENERCVADHRKWRKWRQERLGPFMNAATVSRNMGSKHTVHSVCRHDAMSAVEVCESVVKVYI